MESGLVKRISVLNVPLDIVKKEDLEQVVLSLSEDGRVNQIILLDFPGFMKARRQKSEWCQAVNKASLVLPVSHRIISGAGFLKQEKPIRYKPFDFIISLMGILENRRKSAYLVGSNKKRIQKSFTNLKNSFPGLHFVGRHQGKWHKDREEDILMAIKKSAPALLLAGRGIKGRDLWLHRSKNAFNPGIVLWNKNCFEIIGGRKPKPSETKISRLFRNLLKGILLPWRWLRLFRQIWFWILLVWTRLFEKKVTA
ncbi:MAG: WecB/TagA/CpsF family glycosyltransferase [Spirochaetales bacterium]|nr:WecB/TagA/CpsF family glycosyltransferase [Spirochaetales bacterium]